jgi:hypothetical protein
MLLRIVRLCLKQDANPQKALTSKRILNRLKRQAAFERHWMNGNITKEGIRADLEWMPVGIGFKLRCCLMTPQIVDKAVT